MPICRIPQCVSLSRSASVSLLLLLAGAPLSGGEDNRSEDVAAKVFESAAPSVFVVSVREDGGKLISIGTGFLIAKSTLATNLHVVEGGRLFVETGAVRLPARIEKRDAKNDLAIIKVEAELSAKPLRLADAEVVPGEAIFVIGNPEGLENTISAGIVSGRRELGGRELLQISAPISHGSSGGPVLNASSAVIGIAAAALRDGQNLNFAVPVSALRELLSNEQSLGLSKDVTGPQTFRSDESLSERLTKYVANKMRPEARALLAEAISDDEFDASLRFALGQVLLDTGEWKDAIEQLSLSLRLDGKLWQASESLAHAYLIGWAATTELEYRTSACDAFDQLATHRPEDAGLGAVGLISLFARHPNDLGFAQIRAREAISRLRSPAGLWRSQDDRTYRLGTAQGGWFFSPENINPDTPLDSVMSFGEFNSQGEGTGTGHWQVGDCVAELATEATTGKCGSTMLINGQVTGEAGSMSASGHNSSVRWCKSFFRRMADDLAGHPAFSLRLSRLLRNGEAQWIREK